MNSLMVGIFIGFTLGLAFSLVVWIIASKEKAKEKLEQETLTPYKVFKKPFEVIPPSYAPREDEEVTGRFTRTSLENAKTHETEV